MVGLVLAPQSMLLISMVVYMLLLISRFVVAKRRGTLPEHMLVADEEPAETSENLRRSRQSRSLCTLSLNHALSLDVVKRPAHSKYRVGGALCCRQPHVWVNPCAVDVQYLLCCVPPGNPDRKYVRVPGLYPAPVPSLAYLIAARAAS